MTTTVEEILVGIFRSPSIPPSPALQPSVCWEYLHSRRQQCTALITRNEPSVLTAPSDVSETEQGQTNSYTLLTYIMEDLKTMSDKHWEISLYLVDRASFSNSFYFFTNLIHLVFFTILAYLSLHVSYQSVHHQEDQMLNYTSSFWRRSFSRWSVVGGRWC